MPTVPTNTRPAVEQGAAPRVFQTPTARPGTAGQGLQAIGGTFSGIGGALFTQAEEDQNRQRDLKLREGRVEYNRRVNGELFGDGTPEKPGLYNLRGRQAVEALSSTRERMEGIKNEIMLEFGADPLVGDRLFLDITDRETDHATRMVTFKDKHQRAFAQELSDAEKKESVDAASAAFADLNIIGRSITEVENSVISDGDREGWAPEVVNSKRQEARTAVISAAVTAALKNGDTAIAKDHLKRFKTMLDGPVAAQLQEQVNNATVLKEAQDFADNLFGVPGLTDSKMFEQARTIKDPEIRAAAEKQIAYRISQREAAKDAFMEKVEGDAGAAIDAGENLDSYLGANPSEAQHLLRDNAAMARLRSRQDAKNRRSQFSQTSTGVLEEVEAMPREALAQMSPQVFERLRSQATPQEWGRMSSIYAAARASVDRQSKDFGIYKEGERIMRQYAPGLKFGDKKVNEDLQNLQQVAMNRMREFVQSRLDAGQKPTPAEMADQAMRIALPVEREGFSGFLDAVGLGLDVEIAGQLKQMSPEERSQFVIDMDDVPDHIVQDVKARFRAHNIPDPSGDDIAAFLGAQATNDRARQEQLLGLRTPRTSTVGAAPVATQAPPPAPKRGGSEIPGVDPEIAKLIAVTNEGGFQEDVFDDSRGFKTIGFGFNLDRAGAKKRIEEIGGDFAGLRSGKVKLTRAQANQLFKLDLAEAIDTVDDMVPNADKMSRNRHMALIDMAYNLGSQGFKQFKPTLDLISKGDYDAAAARLRKTPWAKQVKTRADRIIKMIKDG